MRTSAYDRKWFNQEVSPSYPKICRFQICAYVAVLRTSILAFGLSEAGPESRAVAMLDAATHLVAPHLLISAWNFG